jgi:hypothetical protein
MPYLHRLVGEHLPKLSGSEFKLAAYLYDRLETTPRVKESIAAYANATGLSWRQTQSALQSLARKGILGVDTRQKTGTCCWLPETVKAGPSKESPARQSHPRPKHPPRTSPPRSPTPGSPAPSAVSAHTDAASPEPRPPAETMRSPQDTPPVSQSGGPAAPPSAVAPSAKQRKADHLVRSLMDPHKDMSPREFNILLAAADGVLDRLLARLQTLLSQQRRFDNFHLLCSEVRSLVPVR